MFQRWIPATGTDTYAINITSFPTGYNNTLFFTKFPNTNTGAATINANGIGAIPIRYWDGSAWVVLPAGWINTDTVYKLSYSGAYFEMESFGSVGSAWSTTTSGIVEKSTQAEAEAIASAVTSVSVSDDRALSERGIWWFWEKLKTIAVTITGVWNAPTAAAGTNSTQIATTAFVQQEIDSAFTTLSISGSNVNWNAASKFLSNVFVSAAANFSATISNPSRYGELLIQKTVSGNIELQFIGSGLSFYAADNMWSDFANKKITLVGATNSYFRISFISNSTSLFITSIENYI